jgi:prepilin-type N-terminal cleavage/methylation domain-containing protein
MTRRRQQGFTLIEAAVAIAVVAILSGIVVPLVVKNIGDSQIARAKNDVQVIAAAIASQLKDTGTRPSAAGGPGASTGVLWATWQSGGGAATNFTSVPANSFTNLFTVASATATTQTLFYAPTVVTNGMEFSYKGPYLSTEVALKSDPWGTAYMIFGYDASGQAANSPIWVVCAGPDKSILAANAGGNPAAATPVATWVRTTLSADDIAIRVN